MILFTDENDENGYNWDLTKDSLSSQSPETLQFIFNLLNK